MEQWLLDYWKQHGIVGALAAWVVLSSVLNVLFRLKTPAEWIKFAEANPKVNGVVKLIRGWGVDPAAALEAMQVYSQRKAELAAERLKQEQQAMNKTVEPTPASKVEGSE